MSPSCPPPLLAKHSNNGLKVSDKGPSLSYLRSNISNIFRTLKYKFIWGQSDLLKTIVGITFGLTLKNAFQLFYFRRERIRGIGENCSTWRQIQRRKIIWYNTQCYNILFYITSLTSFQIKSKSSYRNLVRKLEKKILKLYRTEMVDATSCHVRLDKLGIDLESSELRTGWCQPVS